MGRSLNGTDAYLSRANSDEFEPLTQSYFLALRFKRATADPVAGSSQCLISVGNQSSTLAGVSAWLYATTSYPGVRCCDASSNRAGKTNETALLDTDWHTLILVIDRTAETITGYLDGVEFDTDGGGGPATASTASVATIDSGAILTVGAANTPGNYFAGSVADVVIGRGSIPTTAQIAAYVGGQCAAQAFSSPWLIAAWPLVGDSLYDVAHPISDFLLTANGTTTATDLSTPSITWDLDPDTTWDSDTFGSADGTALTSHTTANSQAWTEHGSYTTGALEVRSSEVRRVSANANSSLCYLPSTGSRACRITATLKRRDSGSSSSSGGLVFVATDANTLYYANHADAAGANTLDITKFLAGSATRLCRTTGTAPGETGVPVSFERSGNRLIYTFNNKLAGAARINDAALREQPCIPGIRIAGPADANNATDGPAFSGLTVYRGPETVLPLIGTDAGAGSGDAAYQLPHLNETTNKIHLFAEGRQGTALDDAESRIVLVQSDVGTPTSFGSITVPVASGGVIKHNPVSFAHDGTSLTLCYVSLPLELHATSTSVTAHRITSTDEGATWGSPVDITAQVTDTLTRGLTLGAGRGLVTSTGRWLMVCSARDGASDPRRAWVVYSDDEGVTWTTTDLFSEVGANEGSIVELPNGNLLCQLRSNPATAGTDRTSGRSFSTSTDGGATWSTVVRETELISPYAPGGVGDSIHAGFSRLGNNVLWSAPQHAIRGRMGVFASSDSGDTWDDVFAEPGRISGGLVIEHAAAGYSDILALDDDTALIVHTGGLQTNQAYPAAWHGLVSVATVDRAWLGVTNPLSPASGGAFVGGFAFGFGFGGSRIW